MAARMRTIRWAEWNGKGLEHLSLSQSDEGQSAAGVVIAERGGAAFGLTYHLRVDGQWRLRALSAWLTDGSRLHVLSDGRGRWTDAEGRVLGALSGCVDVDIAATPFTNTLPIRRLALKDGEAEEIPVAYIPVPSLAIEPVEQRYTRLAAGRFLYESLSSGFSAELEVDEDGVVRDYPGLFRRVMG